MSRGSMALLKVIRWIGQGEISGLVQNMGSEPSMGGQSMDIGVRAWYRGQSKILGRFNTSFPIKVT